MAAGVGTTENLVVVNRFDLEIDNVQVGQVLQAGGLGDTTEVITAPVVNESGSEIMQKVGGNTQYTDLTFDIHMTDQKYMTDWLQEVEEGKYSSYRRNASVIMYDPEGTEQVRVNLTAAFPISVSLSGLAAGGADAMVMSVTVVYEGLEVVFS